MYLGNKLKKRSECMRLDKFLKISRLIKRRPLAKQVADQGRIKINDLQAKASSNLEVGDQVEIKFGQTTLTIEIVELKDHVNKNEATNFFKKDCLISRFYSIMKHITCFR